jgi:hypothetical protein
LLGYVQRLPFTIPYPHNTLARETVCIGGARPALRPSSRAGAYWCARAAFYTLRCGASACPRSAEDSVTTRMEEVSSNRSIEEEAVDPECEHEWPRMGCVM